jgi:hypothetical protein
MGSRVFRGSQSRLGGWTKFCVLPGNFRPLHGV